MPWKRNESGATPARRRDTCVLSGRPRHVSLGGGRCMTKCFRSWHTHWGKICHQCCRGTAPGHALAAPRLQGYGEKAGTRWARNTDFFEETVMNRSPGRNGGVRVFHSTARTNYKVGLIWISFLAEKSNLEQVIDLMSCFLVTLLCICGVGCVVKKFRPQIL